MAARAGDSKAYDFLIPISELIKDHFFFQPLDAKQFLDNMNQHQHRDEKYSPGTWKELLALGNARVSVEEIEAVVALQGRGQKQRFGICERGGVKLIFAYQGHSGPAYPAITNDTFFTRASSLLVWQNIECRYKTF